MLTMKQYNRFGFNEVDASDNFLEPWWCGDVNFFDVLGDILESYDKESCDVLLKELKEKGCCTMYGEMDIDVTYSIQKGNDPTNVDEYHGGTEFRLEIGLEKIPTGKTFKYGLTMALICDLVADTGWGNETIDTLEQRVKTYSNYDKEMHAYLKYWFDNVAKLAR